MKNLDYFLYFSKPKIEMLHNQIEKKYRTSFEFGFDWVLKGVFKKEKNNSNEVKMLSSVINTIEKNNLMGTIETPNSFIKGRLELAWGRLNFSPNINEGGMIYFTGIKGNTILGLGGSEKNIIGNDRGIDLQKTMSYLLPIEEMIGKYINEIETDQEIRKKNQFFAKNKSINIFEKIYKTFEYFQKENMNKSKFEFVAKVLLKSEDQGDSPKIILASPLYVALQE